MRKGLSSKTTENLSKIIQQLNPCGPKERDDIRP